MFSLTKLSSTVLLSGIELWEFAVSVLLPISGCKTGELGLVTFLATVEEEVKQKSSFLLSEQEQHLTLGWPVLFGSIAEYC